MKAEEQHRAAISKRVPVLGKWLWLIFWLMILKLPVGLLTNGSIVEADTPMAIAGNQLGAIMSIASGIAYWKMASEEHRYRTAGLCLIISAAINLMLELIPGIGETAQLMIFLPVVIVGLVGEYQEYIAHAAVLTGIDDALSDKWVTLWTWYICLFCGLLGSLLIMLITVTVGALIALGTTIGVLVVSILKLVYLYRTANIFREYPV